MKKTETIKSIRNCFFTRIIAILLMVTISLPFFEVLAFAFDSDSDIVLVDIQENLYAEIIQLPSDSPSLSLSKGTWIAPSSESLIKISIDTDQPIENVLVTSSDYSWLTVLGEGSARTIHAAENRTYENRVATVTVSVAGLRRLVDVTQLAFDDTINADDSQLLFLDKNLQIVPLSYNTHPTITHPSINGAVLSLGNLTVQWQSVPDATYHISLRNLTLTPTQNCGPSLIARRQVGSGTSFTIPRSYFTAGHEFRVAIGTNAPSETGMRWSEREFWIEEIVTQPTLPPSTEPPTPPPTTTPPASYPTTPPISPPTSPPPTAPPTTPSPDGSVSVTFNASPGVILGGEADGQMIHMQRGKYGEVLGSMPRFLHRFPTGFYHLIGWFTTRNHLEGRRATENMILPNRDITLYAGWTDPWRHMGYWTYSNVIYLNPDIQMLLVGNEGEQVWQDAINSAIRYWNDSAAPVEFRFNSDIARINAEAGNRFANDIWIIPYEQGTFGKVSPHANNTELFSFSITLNSDYILERANEYDFDRNLYNVIKSVMSHELGHLVGLRDDPLSSGSRVHYNFTIMSTSRVRNYILGPQEFDIESVAILYHDWRGNEKFELVGMQQSIWQSQNVVLGLGSTAVNNANKKLRKEV